VSVATWTGRCTACDREDVEVCSRRTHSERVLCAACAACAASPYSKPSASGLDAPPATGNGVSAREAATSSDRPRTPAPVVPALASRGVAHRVAFAWLAAGSMLLEREARR